jgi:hypothetical protein
MWSCSGGYRREEEKWQEGGIFFSEKKKQKTFATWSRLPGKPAPNG